MATNPATAHRDNDTRTHWASFVTNLPIQLALLLVFMFALIWAGVFVQLRYAREQLVEDAERDRGNLVRVFAEEMRASVRAIDLSLLSLREEWRHHDPAKFHETVLQQQNYFMLDPSFQVCIIGADGMLAYSNRTPGPTRISLAEEEYFRTHVGSGTDRLFIGKPVRGHGSLPWSIQFTRPILDPQRGFLGVIVLSVAPGYLSRFYDSLDLGGEEVVTVTRAQGEILTRAPGQEQALGKSLQGRPFTKPDTPEAGSFRSVGWMDGVERVYTWRKLQDLGLVVVVGEAVDSMLSSYYLQRRGFLLGGVAGSGFLVFFGITIATGLRRREKAASALALSEARSARHAAAINAVGNGVVITDPDAVIEWVNPAFESLTGFSSAQVLGRRPSELFSSGLQDKAFYDEMWKTILSGSTWRGELINKRSDGRLYHAELVVAPIRNAGGKITHFVGIQQDISARKAADEQLRIAAAAFELQEGIIVTDARANILRVNHAFEHITGYTSADVVGKTPAILKSGRQDREFYDRMWHCIGEEGHWQGEIWNRRKNGEIYPEWLVITAVKDNVGRITHYVGAFSDITQRKLDEARIRSLAFYDPLTGLPNRRLLADRAGQALAASARSKRFGALMMIDLDRFKQLNDTWGHDVGDQLLEQVAQRLLGCVRECDTVARFGGDEFVVLVEDLDFERPDAVRQADAIAGKILETLNEPYSLPGLGSEEYRNTPSIGVALFLGRGEPVEALLKHADIALYKAKDAGRNTSRFFEAAS